MKPDLTFDADAHVYRLAGKIVPSVTNVLRGVVPQWMASEWYLQRGTAVHACAALVSRGVDFDFDPQIAGQVQACRQWFKDFQPTVLHVETRVFSQLYGFAGTFDMAIDRDGILFLVDWKASISKAIQWQLGAYAIAAKESLGITFKQGFGVELRADGKYQTGETYDLTRAGREFLAILGAYNAMKRERVT